MKNFTQKLSSLVDEYSAKLAENGVTLEMSRKYFETKPEEYSASAGNSNAILDEIIRSSARKREKKKGYDRKPNRFYSIVFKISPSEKGLLPKELCREYSFIQRSTERQYVGEAPKERTCSEDKLLAKIEKKLRAILKKSQRKTPSELCRDTFWDVPRYLDKRYAYKSRILGRLRADWEIIFIVLFGALALAVSLAIYFL